MTDERDALIRKLRADVDALEKAQAESRASIVKYDREAGRRGLIILAIVHGSYLHDTIGDVREDAERAAMLLGIDIRRIEESEGDVFAVLDERLDGRSLWDLPLEQIED